MLWARQRGGKREVGRRWPWGDGTGHYQRRQGREDALREITGVRVESLTGVPRVSLGSDTSSHYHLHILRWQV